MKKLKKLTILLSTAALAISGSVAPSSAFTFDKLDSKTALAGASVVLSRYMDRNDDAAEQISAVLMFANENSVTDDQKAESDSLEEIYEASKTGIVHVEYSLNIRRLPSTLSEVLAVTGDQSELELLGETTIGGKRWYKVFIYGETGYALSDFVEEFDGVKEINETEESAEEEAVEELTEETVVAEDTTSLRVNDLSNFAFSSADLQNASSEVADRLNALSQEVRYCFGARYPELEGTDDVPSMFSVVVYACDQLQNIVDIASEHGLNDVRVNAAYALEIVNAERSRLSVVSGNSEAELFARIEEANRAQIDAENARLAEEARIAEENARAAEAARLQAEQDALALQQQADEAARAEQEAKDEAEALERQRQAEEARRQAEEAQREAEERKRQEEEAARNADDAANNAELAARCAVQTSVPPRMEGLNYNATGLAIVAAAEPYVGWLPYVYGAASLSSGCDCSGFIASIYAQFGFVSQAWAANHGNYYSGSMRNMGYAVSPSEMQPGDMICYDGHVALFWGLDAVGNARVIHQSVPGRTVEIGYVNYDRIITVRRMY